MKSKQQPKRVSFIFGFSDLIFFCFDFLFFHVHSALRISPIVLLPDVADVCVCVCERVRVI